MAQTWHGRLCFVVRHIFGYDVNLLLVTCWAGFDICRDGLGASFWVILNRTQATGQSLGKSGLSNFLFGKFPLSKLAIQHCFWGSRFATFLKITDNQAPKPSQNDFKARPKPTQNDPNTRSTP